MPNVWLTSGIAWPVLFAGALGIALALTALVLAALRSPATTWLASAALALGALCAALGVGGTFLGRQRIDAAVSVVSPLHGERIRRDGYREAQRSASFGLWCAALPLVGGAAAAMAAPRRKRDPEGETGVDRAPIALPIGAGALGALSVVASVLALRAPLPGRDLAPEDPLWEILELVEEALRVETRAESAEACDKLEARLAREVPDAPPAAPDLPRARLRCTDERIAAAADKEPAEVVLLMRKHRAGWFAASDPEVKRKLQEREDAAEKATEAARPATGMEVGGRISPAAIQRVIRAATPAFKRCFEAALGKGGGSTTVRVRFEIGVDGAAQRPRIESATVKDPGLERCVLERLRKLEFPRPEGGPVSVVYPLRFEVAGGP